MDIRPAWKVGAKKAETHANDMSGACLCCEHGKDPRPTSDVKNGLVFEEMRIVHDRGTIRTRAYGVLQHLFVNA